MHQYRKKRFKSELAKMAKQEKTITEENTTNNNSILKLL